MNIFKINKDEINYLKEKDPLMKKLIEVVGEIKREVEKDPFKSLVSSIVYQQLAYKAANSIWNKFIEKIGELTPKNLLLTTDEELKSCGLSSNKVKYLRSISNYFIKGYENIDWNSLTNEEIISKLTQINGVGKWTAEMFLIFCLERKDISTYGDLGLRYGVKKLYGLNDISEEVFSKITEQYEPYRTVASFYLWELISNKALNINLTIDYKIEETDNGLGYIYSSIGWIEVRTTESKVTNVEFVEYPHFNKMKINEITKKTIDELQEYFSGMRKSFTVPLEMEGTEFQKKVWNELTKIPYGETISYQELAIKIGDIKSSRAVGMANNKNRIAIIIPCHRVIGKNGKLVGYAGGIDKKDILLVSERSNNVNK